MGWNGEDLGSQLRVERERRGMSVRELARRLQVSPSLISQIETGRTRPSVRTLYAIVSELDVSLDEVFNAESPAPPDGARTRAQTAPAAQAAPPEAAAPGTELPGIVQRAATRKTLELETGVRWERLTATHDSNVDFLYVVYRSGGSSASAEGLMVHSGREYGIVLQGRLNVTVGFDEVVLGPGDSISFDSTTPHQLRNDGAEPAHAIWFVIGRRGDSRAAPLRGADG
jgi:transcriptional regulator with XRE-family HTH domain